MTKDFFNHKNEKYFFQLKTGETLSLTDEEMLVFVYLYSSNGLNYTQKEVADFFDLERTDIKQILTLCGIDKKIDIVLPHRLYSIQSQEEMDREIRSNTQKAKELVALRKIDNIGSDNPTSVEVSSKELKVFDNSVFIVNFSDWHIGRLVSKDSGLEEFNYEILKERIGRVIEEVILYSKIYSPHKIFVNFLGDLIDGPLANMHKNQGLCQEFGSHTQIDKCRALVLYTLNKLSGHFQCPIEVYAVPGNHDRVTTDKSEDTEFIAHSAIFNGVSLSLGSSSNIKINKVDGIFRWNCYNVNESVRVLMYHGDNSLNAQKLLNADMRHGAEYKLVIRGHEHRRVFNESGRNFAEIVNPSLLGSTEFGYYENAYITRPGQSMVIVVPKYGIDNVQCIWLDC